MSGSVVGPSGATSGSGSGSTSSGTVGGTGSASTGMSTSGSITSGSSSGKVAEAGAGCAVEGDGGTGTGCSQTVEIVGPASACSPDDAGALSYDLCDALCGESACFSIRSRPFSCRVTEQAQGTYVICDYPQATLGRRPEGLADATFSGPDVVARFLAEAAYLEAASVDAFEKLARELEAYGAPKRLRTASRRAARDEVRHARVTTKLAERAGATVPPCHVEASPVRSLEEMALENAVEGCVRETFAVAIAMIQAEQADDTGVRRAMKPIARDETRHAELSWAVAKWLDTQLDAPARARVERARAEAVEALMQSFELEPDAALTRRLGFPDAAQSRAALNELRSSLWSTQAA